MGDKEAGLLPKYYVERTDGKPVNWCFVLQDTDPLAIDALRLYARSADIAGYHALAADLRQKIGEMIYSQAKAQGEEPCPSTIARNALNNPGYCPYCMRCPRLVRMQKTDEPFLWRCKCGAEHDERPNVIAIRIGESQSSA